MQAEFLSRSWMDILHGGADQDQITEDGSGFDTETEEDENNGVADEMDVADKGNGAESVDQMPGLVFHEAEGESDGESD